jgi:DNA repair exonuclease SbcCD ATPase subunit
MITFRTLRWKNLLSTGNYFSEIQLDGNSNTLVVGENGSGKSTMLDALCFALFGKPFRSINKPQLINSINGKDCVVEIEFETNNKKYKIVRGIKPNLFEIYCDGNLLNQDAASRDYQEHLEKFIIKMNYKSFTQIVILGSASFTPFMQLSAADRRAIIEDLLDIEIFSTMNALVKERLSINKDMIATNKHDIDLVEQKYNLLKKHIDDIKHDNEEKVLEYQNSILVTRGEIQNLHVEITNVSTQIESYEKLVVDKNEIESKLKKITKLESQIETNLSKFKKDIHFFQHNDDCPTCRQKIALGFKQTEIANNEVKVTESVDGLKKINEKITSEQEKLNEIVDAEKKINALKIQLAQKNTSVENLEKNITYLENQKNKVVGAKTSLKNDENDLEVVEKEMQSLRDDLKELIDEKTYYDAAYNLLKDTGIKTKIVKQYLPVINKLVNKYLSTLNFFVNFNLDESFKETIKSRHRDEFTYSNFSEGEKQRIDMALMLTWRAVAKLKNSSNTNLLILDETFDSSLDSNGTEELMKILHTLEGCNLFVISHKGDILQDKFMNVIRFAKEKNFSRMVK